MENKSGKSGWNYIYIKQIDAHERILIVENVDTELDTELVNVHK